MRVAHLEYGGHWEDTSARVRMAYTLRTIDTGVRIAVENVPALCDREWYAALEGHAPTTWSQRVRGHSDGHGRDPRSASMKHESVDTSSARDRRMPDKRSLSCEIPRALARGSSLNGALRWRTLSTYG